MASAAAAASLTPKQQQLYQQCQSLLAEATANGPSLEPLQRLNELCLHQTGDGRTHADTVAVLVALLPEVASQLQPLHSSKLRLWLVEFIEAAVRLDAARCTPAVLSILTSMTSEENVAVVKKVISCGCTLYPLVYAWLLQNSASWGGGT